MDGLNLLLQNVLYIKIDFTSIIWSLTPKYVKYCNLCTFCHDQEVVAKFCKGEGTVNNMDASETWSVHYIILI
jgi:hypothetical protein